MKHFNKVLLCISEAVINSIVHGNKKDKTKKVTIRIECSDKQMDIYIKDEGKGFDLNNVSNPTLKQNIKKESGRGIHIIKSLSKEIEFHNEGNYIQFKIECSE
jgi:serine/threonine-protein kinase RsbW